MLVSHLNENFVEIFKDQMRFVSTLITAISLDQSTIFQESGYIDIMIEKFVGHYSVDYLEERYLIEIICEFFCKINPNMICMTINKNPELIETIIYQLEGSNNDKNTVFCLLKIFKYIIEALISDGNTNNRDMLASIKDYDNFLSVLEGLKLYIMANGQSNLCNEAVELISLINDISEDYE